MPRYARGVLAVLVAVVLAASVAPSAAGEEVGPPEWDVSGDVQLDLLTADRVFVNRNGGLTIEGRLWCPSIGPLPIDQYVGVSWDAIQYAGRRLAITAAYEPAIAHDCLSETTPETPVSWRTLGPGTQNEVQWIYSSSGKFGAGMVHLEVRVEASQTQVTQWWDATRDDFDPNCSADVVPSGYYDRNGDGFCAYSILVWGAEQFDLRAQRVR